MSSEGSVKITATAPKIGRSISFTREFGNNLTELSANLTEPVVYNLAMQQLVIRTQAAARSALEALKDKADPDLGYRYTDEEAIDIGMNYVPGVSRGGGGGGVTIQKVRDKVASELAKGTLSLEELQALVAAKRAEMEAATQATQAEQAPAAPAAEAEAKPSRKSKN
jgi:hypothetical protein